MKTSEIICKQMQADVPVIQSNTKSESESESNANATAFDRFWAAYPKKVGKQAALSAYKKVKVPVDTLIAAVEAQKASAQWTKDNGQYIPNPATWLNQGRWEDVLEAPVVQQAAGFTPGTAEMGALANLARLREQMKEGG